MGDGDTQRAASIVTFIVKVTYIPKLGLFQEPGEGIDIQGQLQLRSFVTVPVTYASDHVVGAELILFADASSNSVTFTLPDADEMPGLNLRFKKIDASGNAMILAPSGSQEIDGETSLEVTDQWTSVDIIASGSAWYII